MRRLPLLALPLVLLAACATGSGDVGEGAGGGGGQVKYDGGSDAHLDATADATDGSSDAQDATASDATGDTAADAVATDASDATADAGDAADDSVTLADAADDVALDVSIDDAATDVIDDVADDFIYTEASPDGKGNDAGDAGTDAADAGDASDAAAPCSGDVVINEVQTAGTNSSANEFVELYNPAACTVYFTGDLAYRSQSGSSDIVLYTFHNKSFASHSYFVLGGYKFTGPKNASFTSTASSGVLGGGSGGVGFVDANYVYDSVGYGTGTNNDFVEPYQVSPFRPAPSPVAGDSIGRYPDGTDTDSSKNDWHACTSTPGAANVCP